MPIARITGMNRRTVSKPLKEREMKPYKQRYSVVYMEFFNYKALLKLIFFLKFKMGCPLFIRGHHNILIC